MPKSEEKGKKNGKVLKISGRHGGKQSKIQGVQLEKKLIWARYNTVKLTAIINFFMYRKIQVKMSK